MDFLCHSDAIWQVPGTLVGPLWGAMTRCVRCISDPQRKGRFCINLSAKAHICKLWPIRQPYVATYQIQIRNTDDIWQSDAREEGLYQLRLTTWLRSRSPIVLDVC